MQSFTLDDECRAFTRYLIGSQPSPYVLDQYRRAHRLPALDEGQSDSFDRLMLGLARRQWFGLALVDAYATIFRRASLIRKKLILLLSILECTDPSYQFFEGPGEGTKTSLNARLLADCAAAVLSFGVATVCLLPLQLLLRQRPGSAPVFEPPLPEVTSAGELALSPQVEVAAIRFPRWELTVLPAGSSLDRAEAVDGPELAIGAGASGGRRWGE